MAPYLYILAHDTLVLTFKDPTWNIQESLPNGPKIFNLSFGNDSTLYLLSTKDNLSATKTAMDYFSLASSSQVNWTKIHTFWASKNPRTTVWGSKLDFN
jgi:hypothetical protein